MAEAENRPLPGRCPIGCPKTPPAADFDPTAVAKELLRATRAGALATIDRNTGHPFASLVNVATDVDGSPLILMSRLSTHTANLEVDPRASLLLASAGKGDPLAHPRLTVLGAFEQVPRDDRGRAARAPAFPRPPSEIASFMPALPIFRSGGWKWCPPISMAASPALPI